MEYSDDQAVAFDAVAEALLSAGIDLKNDSLLPQSDNKNKILKDLLSIYVQYEIIDLNQHEFDAFMIFE